MSKKVTINYVLLLHSNNSCHTRKTYLNIFLKIPHHKNVFPYELQNERMSLQIQAIRKAYNHFWINQYGINFMQRKGEREGVFITFSDSSMHFARVSLFNFAFNLLTI